MDETLKARQKIIEYKEEKAMTYKQLALMLNKHETYIQDVLTGERKGPRANELILKIIQMFGIK